MISLFRSMPRTACLFACIISMMYLAGCRQEDRASKRPDLHKKHEKAPPLKSLRLYVTEGQGGTEVLSRMERYDEKGRRIFYAEYGPTGDTTDTRVEIYTSYDAKGNIAELKTVNRVEGTAMQERNVYDKDNRLVRVHWMSSNGDTGHREYMYDPTGKQVRMDIYLGETFLVTQLTPVDTNSRGQALASYYKEHRGGKDTLTKERTEYLYDSLDRMVAKQVLNQQSMPVTLEQFVYDSLDNPTLRIVYRPDTTVGSDKLTRYMDILNKYNEYGDVLQSTVMMYGKLYQRISYTYDKYGQIQEVVTSYPDGRTSRERYEYEYWKK